MTSGYTSLLLDDIIDHDLTIISLLMGGEVDARIVRGGVVEVRNSDLDTFYTLLNRSG